MGVICLYPHQMLSSQFGHWATLTCVIFENKQTEKCDGELVPCEC